MIKENTFKVTFENGVRPAGKQDECFYCQEKIGGYHKEDCVMRSKTVVVDYTFRMVLTFPISFDKDMIEFNRNDATWCADNALNELIKSQKYLAKQENCIYKCMCRADKFKAKFIREATEKDEEIYGVNGKF